MKLFALKSIETLLLETLDCFSNKDKIKMNFDRHKGDVWLSCNVEVNRR